MNPPDFLVNVAPPVTMAVYENVCCEVVAGAVVCAKAHGETNNAAAANAAVQKRFINRNSFVSRRG
jgi:hypothetical protein